MNSRRARSWSFLALTMVSSSLLAQDPFVFSNGVSVPSDFPFVKILTSTNPSPGNVFINNWGGTPYIAILTNAGEPLFYRRMPSPARDFKLQPTGILTYRLEEGFKRFYGLDSAFVVCDAFDAGPGFETDEHELQLLPNGHALLIALEYKQVDMRPFVQGGNANARIIGNTIQELDASGKVVFEWKGWDHFAYSDAIGVNLTASVIDYMHMNALALDRDGNILVSTRHLSEVTKIDRRTGAILWRLGGRNNQFTFLNDPAKFTWQHDIRVLANGHYTLFDNGNWHTPSYSRAVEYEIDTASKTATMVWQYRHSPDRFSGWMGNVQRLANGNTLINWADQSLPKLTEVTPQGTKVLEMDFVSPAHSYRVFKFDWMGKAATPYLIAEPYHDRVTVLVNAFGDADIRVYKIYGARADLSGSQPFQLLDSTTSSFVNVSGLVNHAWYTFRATAVHHDGTESEPSNEERVMVNFLNPGENMVVNGNYSAGLDFWKVDLYDGAAAIPMATDAGEFYAAITTPGATAWDVQLLQRGLVLEKGKQYVFEFEARAFSPRTIDAKLETDGSPYTNYSRTGLFPLTASRKKFSTTFTMTDASDYAARVVFNVGQYDPDVFIDNVAIREIVASSVPAEPIDPLNFRLDPAYPNPFNPTTTIAFALDREAEVRLEIVDLLGRTVETLVNEPRRAGRYSQQWDARQVTSGLYFCILRVSSVGMSPVRQRAQKLLLVK